MGLKSIFSYADYREFLRDFYDDKKVGNPKYSYRVFANAAGLGSPNYLKLVIDGTRNLTVSNIHQFAKALRLERDEHTYFEALVLLNQASTSEEKKYYAKRLADLKRDTGGKTLKLTNEKDIVSHYLFPAIMIALLEVPVHGAAKQVARRFGLGEEFLQTAIDFLVDSKLTTIEGDRFTLNADHYFFSDPMPNRRQKQFLRRQLGLSLQAFDRAYDDGARFFSHTFTLPKSAFAYCVEEIDKFIAKVNRDCGELPPEMIAQLNVQLFRLDKRIIGKA